MFSYQALHVELTCAVFEGCYEILKIIYDFKDD